MAEFKLPTETVELPSKGLLYPADSPLASGTIEMKYMTAKEEDILSNQNFIQKGVVIDKLLEALIVTPNINYSDLLIGDKNAIMVAARILSYGKEYSFSYGSEERVVDLTTLKTRELNGELVKDRTNSFNFTLPNSGNSITFRLLTHQDERNIDRELEGLKKINKESSAEVTTRLKHIITSVNNITEQKDIRNFVDNFLLAKDARALREEYERINPDVIMEFKYDNENGVEEDATLPITLNFFWPDARL